MKEQKISIFSNHGAWSKRDEGALLKGHPPSFPSKGTLDNNTKEFDPCLGQMDTVHFENSWHRVPPSNSPWTLTSKKFEYPEALHLIERSTPVTAIETAEDLLMKREN